MYNLTDGNCKFNKVYVFITSKSIDFLKTLCYIQRRLSTKTKTPTLTTKISSTSNLFDGWSVAAIENMLYIL